METFAQDILIDQMRSIRIEHPNLRNQNIQVMIKPWCDGKQLPVPSAHTIGRLIDLDPARQTFPGLSPRSDRQRRRICKRTPERRWTRMALGLA
jgi:hypothetical protein